MTQTSLLKDFTKYVGLNILGMIGMSCYILADTFFVAKALGADGLTALNFCISVFSILQGFGLMLGIGGATKYAIVRGRGEGQEGNSIFTLTIVIGVLVAIAFVIIGIFFAAPVSKLLGADAYTLPLSTVYMTTILCFAPCFLLNNIVLAFVRNDHNPRLSMTAMLVSSFSNIILDYIFIFPLGMGMFGAAFATGLSPVISLGILSIHFLKKKNGFHLSRSIGVGKLKKAVDILFLGLSSFIGELSSAIALITFNLVILQLEGNIGVAAYGIVANLALIAVAIFTGIAQGLQPLTSRSYGEGQPEQARYVYRYAVISAFALALSIYIIIYVGKVPLATVFNRDHNEVLAGFATKGMVIYFVGFFFAGINIVTAAFLSAATRAKEAFLISIARSMLILVPMLLVMSHLLGMTGVWLSFVFTEMFVCIFSIVRVKQGGGLKSLS